MNSMKLIFLNILLILIFLTIAWLIWYKLPVIFIKTKKRGKIFFTLWYVSSIIFFFPIATILLCTAHIRGNNFRYKKEQKTLGQKIERLQG